LPAYAPSMPLTNSEGGYRRKATHMVLRHVLPRLSHRSFRCSYRGQRPQEYTSHHRIFCPRVERQSSVKTAAAWRRLEERTAERADPIPRVPAYCRWQRRFYNTRRAEVEKAMNLNESDEKPKAQPPTACFARRNGTMIENHVRDSRVSAPH